MATTVGALSQYINYSINNWITSFPWKEVIKRKLSDSYSFTKKVLSCKTDKVNQQIWRKKRVLNEFMVYKIVRHGSTSVWGDREKTTKFTSSEKIQHDVNSCAQNRTLWGNLNCTTLWFCCIRGFVKKSTTRGPARGQQAQEIERTEWAYIRLYCSVLYIVCRDYLRIP